MILRRRQNQHALAIGQREDRQLLAFEELLDQHLFARLSQRPVQHRADDLGRVDATLAHDGPFPSRQSRGLHDERLRMIADVLERGPDTDERRTLGGGYAGAMHDLLGVRLRRLEPRRRRRWPEHGPAVVPQPVSQPGGERGFRPDDRDVDIPVADGGNEVVDGGGGDGKVGGEGRGAGIAGCGEQR